MFASIFIILYFSFKLVLAENLNDTTFLFKIQKTEDEEGKDECIEIIKS